MGICSVGIFSVSGEEWEGNVSLGIVSRADVEDTSGPAREVNVLRRVRQCRRRYGYSFGKFIIRPLSASQVGSSAMNNCIPHRAQNLPPNLFSTEAEQPADLVILWSCQCSAMTDKEIVAYRFASRRYISNPRVTGFHEHDALLICASVKDHYMTDPYPSEISLGRKSVQPRDHFDCIRCSINKNELNWQNQKATSWTLQVNSAGRPRTPFTVQAAPTLSQPWRDARQPGTTQGRVEPGLYGVSSACISIIRWECEQLVWVRMDQSWTQAGGFPGGRPILWPLNEPAAPLLCSQTEF